MRQKMTDEKKAALRAECLKMRKTLERYEAHIEDFCGTKEFVNAQNIFCYVSFGSEIGTHLLLSEILRTGKTLLVPCCLDNDGHMCAVQIKDPKELKKGHFGIYEPEKRQPFLPQAIDAAIIPAAAYTKEGARLGMGKGYYDRFLKTTNAYKIGLIHRELVVENVYSREWDVSVDKVITY